MSAFSAACPPFRQLPSDPPEKLSGHRVKDEKLSPGERREAASARAIFAAVRRSVKPVRIECWPWLLIALLAACSGPAPPGVYPAGSDRPLALQLKHLTGVRDGDRMTAELEYSGGERRSLLIELQLAVGVPTRLKRGTFRMRGPGGEENGEVRARSLTFLGGQSDWPNLGGSLELIAQQKVRYLVRFPPTPVNPHGPAGR